MVSSMRVKTVESSGSLLCFHGFRLHGILGGFKFPPPPPLIVLFYLQSEKIRVVVLQT